ncbi:hypothetical protein WS84_10510 [Burkholderia anthina]|nr:hypothetical protein WS85_17495 [Burkholderia anthina]KVH13094.1 hypothetical protein WS84_10510 [Burkholderia anthina]OXI27116.1 hypothetical protein CFB35_11300 [Burkholderia sp. AU16482]
MHREADQPAAQVATAGFPAFVDARGNAPAMRRAHEPVDGRQPRKHHLRAAGTATFIGSAPRVRPRTASP